jgi:uncharacterized membrane protein
MSNSKLVVLTFAEEDYFDDIRGLRDTAIEKGIKETLAWAAWKSIKDKAKETDVKLEDAVVVYKTKDGQIKIKQIVDMTAGKGAKRGSFWGFLVGLVLGGPIAGALGGLALGTIYGGLKDKGLDDDFVKDVTKTMSSHSSAIFILIDEAMYEPAVAYLKTFDAEIFESDFHTDTEEAVDKAVDNEEVAKAVQAHMSEE